MKTLRVIGQTRYEDRGYSNEESIAYLQLQKPEEINSFLTYNYGMDDDRFPLSFITEGQGSRGIKNVSTVQWTWKTMGRMKFTDFVTYFNTAVTKPGQMVVNLKFISLLIGLLNNMVLLLLMVLLKFVFRKT